MIYYYYGRGYETIMVEVLLWRACIAWVVFQDEICYCFNCFGDEGFSRDYLELEVRFRVPLEGRKLKRRLERRDEEEETRKKR